MTVGYPVTLRLTGRRCVVVGGGSVATRKVSALRRAAAEVVVVAPAVAPEIGQLAEAGALMLARRPFEPADLDGAFLAFAATDDRRVNTEVVTAARVRGVLVNVADDPDACDFTVPATVRRRGVTLAISTDGKSPAFARYLREQLDEWLTDARCAMLDLLAELRRDLRSAGRQPHPESWRRAIADEDAARAIAEGDRERARRRLFATLMSGR